MDSSILQKESTGGTIALLNLQPYTSLNLDGSASQTLKHEENLLVIDNITPLHGCHLLVVRANNSSNSEAGNNLGCAGGDESRKSRNNNAVMLSIGILILFPNQKVDHDKEDNNWFIAREFDVNTEEISSRSLDTISYNNLKHCIKNKNEHVNALKIISYNRFIHNDNNNNRQSVYCDNKVWETYLTSFISLDVLSLHGLSGKGDKIVPGSFSQDEDNTIQSSHILAETKNFKDNDGITLSYPPIPHIDRSHQRSINSHLGTRRFLASLPPTERTSFFINSNKMGTNEGQDGSTLMFEKVLSSYFKGDWKVMLGQFQLSFILFLCCSCLSSLEHWRDLIQLMTLVNHTTVLSHSKLFEGFLISLKYQLFSFDNDIFQDEEIMNGNFLFPSIQRLCLICSNQTERNNLVLAAKDLLQNIKTSFPNLTDVDMESDNNRDGIEYEEEDDDNDDDNPIVIPFEEIEASIGRSTSTATKISNNALDYKKSIYSSKYPFLFASIMEGEDILMTCARILDEKSNVTAVREAALYLEEVEASSMFSE